MKISLCLLCYIGALAVAGTATSCLTPPDYSNTPSISFNSIIDKRIADANGFFTDSVIVKVDFRDGDGDLGLASTEMTAPYARLNANGSSNKFYNNYFVQLQVKLRTDTEFRDKTFYSSDEYSGRYPRLSTIDKAEPLKGTINRVFTFSQGTFQPQTQIRFKVSIADRALNVSNEVVTDPVTIIN